MFATTVVIWLEGDWNCCAVAGAYARAFNCELLLLHVLLFLLFLVLSLAVLLVLSLLLLPMLLSVLLF